MHAAQVPSEVELLVQDAEVDDGNDDLHDRYEGGDEHGPPLLDAPRQQNERDAASDDALSSKKSGTRVRFRVPDRRGSIQYPARMAETYGVQDGEDLELALDDPWRDGPLGAEPNDGYLEEAEP